MNFEFLTKIITIILNHQPWCWWWAMAGSAYCKIEVSIIFKYYPKIKLGCYYFTMYHVKLSFTTRYSWRLWWWNLESEITWYIIFFIFHVVVATLCKTRIVSNMFLFFRNWICCIGDGRMDVGMERKNGKGRRKRY